MNVPDCLLYTGGSGGSEGTSLGAEYSSNGEGEEVLRFRQLYPQETRKVKEQGEGEGHKSSSTLQGKVQFAHRSIILSLPKQYPIPKQINF